mmetsp:Transcript_8339/g.9701  ORF Transcript_8339/g.9701 Transcript_8339/m.9701 type:complete len:197 (+) Transcript_8339:72-662(+)|eukprot:CAMPEP_0197852952 /NCGR_PEP_ID=MMETSP1438-20131217/21817_1 /TAXON_ID=1461541 /ORGANISM="Pterosperma sp., Strain CCMP1384" /LENGTH=196 /DNA_ID=CAMNT_0043467197 /DNA_START=71 /DNA_END=661 /DNA_ORIENTATION=-
MHTPARSTFLLAFVLSVATLGNCYDFESEPNRHMWDGVMTDNPLTILEALQDGADINGKHPGNGQTPLMASVLQGQENAVIMLLDKGADTSIPERDGYTPVHGAGFQGRASIMKILVQQAGMDPNDMHPDGFTPLHRACWGATPRHADTVKMLLILGVPYDQAAANGNTCMDITPNEQTKKALKNWKAQLARKDEL